MAVFFQHVGERGGQRDFPRTIGTLDAGLRRFTFSELEPYLSDLPAKELEALRTQLETIAPEGFQVWGIPSGRSEFYAHFQKVTFYCWSRASGLAAGWLMAERL